MVVTIRVIGKFINDYNEFVTESRLITLNNLNNEINNTSDLLTYIDKYGFDEFKEKINSVDIQSIEYVPENYLEYFLKENDLSYCREKDLIDVYEINKELFENPTINLRNKCIIFNNLVLTYIKGYNKALEFVDKLN